MNNENYIPSLADIEELENALQDYKDLQQSIALGQVVLDDDSAGRLSDLDKDLEDLAEGLECAVSDLTLGQTDLEVDEDLAELGNGILD